MSKLYKINSIERYSQHEIYTRVKNGQADNAEDWCEKKVKEILNKENANIYISSGDHRKAVRMENKTNIKTNYYFNETERSWEVLVSFDIPFIQIEEKKHEQVS